MNERIEFDHITEEECKMLFDACKYFEMGLIRRVTSRTQELRGIIQNPIKINKDELKQYLTNLIDNIDDIPDKDQKEFKKLLYKITQFVQTNML